MDEFEGDFTRPRQVASLRIATPALARIQDQSFPVLHNRI